MRVSYLTMFVLFAAGSTAIGAEETGMTSVMEQCWNIYLAAADETADSQFSSTLRANASLLEKAHSGFSSEYGRDLAELFCETAKPVPSTVQDCDAVLGLIQ